MSNTVCIARWRAGGVFDIALEVVEDRPGYLAFRVSGKDGQRVFSHETGGHRWQRVPPTEKRGRVHTSTVTVAVLVEPLDSQIQIPERDIDVRTTRSGGPGGQHANKTDSAVIMTHRPTGISVRVETKSQHRNREIAFGILRARIFELEESRIAKKRNSQRRSQVGSGMRGDKVRTIALQRDQVTDHRTGRSMSAKKYLRGLLEDLW